MKKVNLTCVECPLGCDITVELDGEKVLSVQGNTCPRGEKYARDEVVCPKRVLTTTIKLSDGRMLPVKTSEPILKSEITSAMQKINCVITSAPIKIGDVIIKDLYLGVDLVATANVQ